LPPCWAVGKSIGSGLWGVSRLDSRGPTPQVAMELAQQPPTAWYAADAAKLSRGYTRQPSDEYANCRSWTPGRFCRAAAAARRGLAMGGSWRPWPGAFRWRVTQWMAQSVARLGRILSAKHVTECVGLNRKTVRDAATPQSSSSRTARRFSRWADDVGGRGCAAVLSEFLGEQGRTQPEHGAVKSERSP